MSLITICGTCGRKIYWEYTFKEVKCAHCGTRYEPGEIEDENASMLTLVKVE